MRILFLALFLSTISLAAESAKPKMAALQQRFEAYTYANLEDRAKGAQDVESVHASIQKFLNDQTPYEKRTEEFKTLVKLIAAALPYDEETGLADSLNDMIQNPVLKKTYAAALNEISDTCRRDFLRISVQQHACADENRVSASGDPTCTAPEMDFDECLKRATPASQSGKKPSNIKKKSSGT